MKLGYNRDYRRRASRKLASAIKLEESKFTMLRDQPVLKKDMEKRNKRLLVKADTIHSLKLQYKQVVANEAPDPVDTSSPTTPVTPTCDNMKAK